MQQLYINNKGKAIFTISSLATNLFCISQFANICMATSWALETVLYAFIAIIACVAISRRRIPVHGYFAFQLILLLYFLAMIIAGLSTAGSISLAALISLVKNFVSDYAIFIFVVASASYTRKMKGYIGSAIVALSVLMIYNVNLTNITRIDTSTVHVMPLGLDIRGPVATSLGYISSMLFYLLMMEKDTFTHKWLWYVSMGFCGVVTLISGTRKVLLIIVIAVIMIPMLNTEINAAKANKILKVLFICVAVSIAIYFLLMKIPTLYEVLGRRLESAINMLMYEGSVEDRSMVIRYGLRDMAYEAITEKPVFGWGLNSFRYTINNTYKAKDANTFYYSHSNYTEMLVNGGIIAFLLYYLKYAWLLKGLYRIKKSQLASNNQRFHAKCYILLIFLVVVLDYWQITYSFPNLTMPCIMITAYVSMPEQNRVICQGKKSARRW